VRLIFKELESFQKWISDLNSDRYVCYSTDSNEVIIVPTRSTRPLIYGYIRIPKESKNVLKDLESLGFKIYRVSRVEWADDRPVGAKMPVEE